jgi:DNA-binding NtrC family response regulator
MESLKKGPSSTHEFATSPVEDLLSLVLVGLTEPETRPLCEIAQQWGWRLQKAASYREAMARLCLNRTPVIVCNRHLPDGTWEDVLSGTAAQNDRPRLIVVSRHADERLWVEVLDLGGFDVVASPFTESEIRHSVQTAWRNWTDEVRQEAWRRPVTAVAGAASYRHA